MFIISYTTISYKPVVTSLYSYLLRIKDRVKKCLNTIDYPLSAKRKELSIYERELKVKTKLAALLPKAAI
jgi:hypothetical protein